MYLSHRQKIIISADDFGFSPRANRNIRHLISLGKIDRIAVMVNGVFSDSEIEEIMRSGVKIDIHLDILKKNNKENRRRSGFFLRGLEFIWKIITRQISSAKVENDWRAQIEKFRRVFGRNPDGINSHEHVHFFPPFLKIALRLETEYLIPYIRFGNSFFMSHRNMSAKVLYWLRSLSRKTFQKSGCVSSESLISLNWIENIDNFLDNLPEGKIEIVCHPEIAEDFVKIKKYF